MLRLGVSKQSAGGGGRWGASEGRLVCEEPASLLLLLRLGLLWVSKQATGSRGGRRGAESGSKGGFRLLIAECGRAAKGDCSLLLLGIVRPKGAPGRTKRCAGGWLGSKSGLLGLLGLLAKQSASGIGCTEAGAGRTEAGRIGGGLCGAERKSRLGLRGGTEGPPPPRVLSLAKRVRSPGAAKAAGVGRGAGSKEPSGSSRGGVAGAKQTTGGGRLGPKKPAGGSVGSSIATECAASRLSESTSLLITGVSKQPTGAGRSAAGGTKARSGGGPGVCLTEPSTETKAATARRAGRVVAEAPVLVVVLKAQLLIRTAS